MKAEWIRKSYRANLVDIHIPDDDPAFLSRFDPAEYVQRLVEAHVDAAYIYATSCLGISNWPTKIGHQHRALAANSGDPFGEVLQLCREHGLHVIAYQNYWSKWAYDNHPDWRMIRHDGKGSLEYLGRLPRRFGVCCFNTPYGGYFLELTAELCSAYEFDGLWFDMLSLSGQVCYCDGCRQRYRIETGLEIPERVDWEDPTWVGFQRTRERWLADFAGKLKDLAKELQPGISVGFNHALLRGGWANGFSDAFFQYSDYLSGDFYGGAAEQSLMCKLFENLGRDPLSEYMTCLCANLQEHTIIKPKELLEAEAFAALANNKRFLFIDAIHPEGSMKPGVYPEMGEIFAKLSAYERHLSPTMKLHSEVGIYINWESQVDLDQSGRHIQDVQNRPGDRNGLVPIIHALTADHVPFDILTPASLDALESYQVVVLPDLAFMDDREIEALKHYVAGGGSLYASGQSSLRTKDGRRAEDFLLAEMFGASLVGGFDLAPTFLAPAPGHEALLGGFTQRYPLTIRRGQTRLEAREGAVVLAHVGLPYAPEDVDRFSTANCDPPHEVTASPALILNRFGDGQCLLSAALLEREETHAHRQIFAALIRSLARRPFAVRTDAPGCVEITILQERTIDRSVICLLNFQSQLPNLPVHDVSVWARVDPSRPPTVVRLPDGERIPIDLDDGFARFVVPRLDTFAAYALEPGIT